MILRNYSRAMWSLAVVAIALGNSAGCRSTSRWNPTTWFAGREPDASMIAGRSGAPELPTSPSLNHTPTALASNYGATAGGPATSAPSGSGVNPSGVPANTGSVPTNSSAPFASNPYGGSNAYGNNAYSGQSANGTAPQSGGLAARSNGFHTGSQPNSGYQTGPYGMSPASTAANTSIPNGAGSASNVVATPNVNSKPTGAFPNPYGSSYGQASMPRTNGSSGPNSGAFASTANVGASSGTSSGTFQGTTSVSAATTPPSSPVSWSVPEYPSLPAIPVSATVNSSNIGTNIGTMAPPTQNLQNGVPTNSGSSSSPHSTNPALPAPSAYQAAPPAGNYSPGTTGRSTNYNFGTGGSQNSVPPSSSSFPPNTATGNSSWVR